MEKQFRNRAESRCYGIIKPYQAASLADAYFDIAFDRIIPNQFMKDYSFDSGSELCWKKLPECEELATLMFDRAVDELLEDIK